MKILFICNQGKYRSPTAAKLYKKLYPKSETKYLGIFVDNNIKETLDWADKIYVMEMQQYDEIMRIDERLKTMQKIDILNIDDIYKLDDKRLIKILEKKFELD